VNEPTYDFDGSGLEVRFGFAEEYKKRMNESENGTQNKSVETDPENCPENCPEK